jgi:D-alanine-D-alanine ligase
MKITVLLGGTSAERDVSIVSGLRVIQALRERGHDVRAVDPASGLLSAADEDRMQREGVKVAPPSLATLRRMSQSAAPTSLGTLASVTESDVVFLALHGGQGEDGTIQAMLDVMGVPYTGSGHMASALAMDKDLSKHLMRAHGVPTPDWLMAPVSVAEVESRMGFPVVVKPSKQGSTVGLSVVHEASRLDEATKDAFEYDDEVMVEQFIAGRELTVGVLGGMVLPVGEIIPKHEIYDYECKYTAGMAHEEFPAKLSAHETATVQRHALDAFNALKLGGCARIDFRMSSDGMFHCLEANTLPGLTPLSLIPQAAAAMEISFPDLCEKIVELALERRRPST